MAQRPSKKIIARAFGKKATTYEKSAHVQVSICEKVLTYIHKYNSPNQKWADLGCGTGFLSRRLHQFGNSVTCADLSFETLNHIDVMVEKVQADIEQLPFKRCSFDGVAILSVLQWLHEPWNALEIIHEILKPRGKLVFSLFVNDSFHELNTTREKSNLSSPIYTCDSIDVISKIESAGFIIKEISQLVTKVYFPNAMDALRSLSAIGGTAVSGKRMSIRELNAFCSLYESKFTEEKGVPITYSALFGIAEKLS